MRFCMARKLLGCGADRNENAITSDIPDGFPSGRFSAALPCAGCTNVLTSRTTMLVNENQPWGKVLYALRGTADPLFFFSRVRDLSRQAQTEGTEVPVVRESDFRAAGRRFPNVPTDSRYRTLLRAWTIGDDQLYVYVEVPLIPPLFTAAGTQRIAGTAMSFASVDLEVKRPRVG